jgi:HK97 family phage portal protein
MRRLEALYATASGVVVTPESCMQAPTVQAIVTYLSRRISTLPVKVYQQTASNGRTRKEHLPSHPVARLLNKPNDWQTRTSYWLDAVSRLVRYNNCYLIKLRGQTGPIRQLVPVHPSCVAVEQDPDTMVVTYRVRFSNGRQREYSSADVHHIRGLSRDGLMGDSPVVDIREAIALEIAAERMGASFLGNGALPSTIFKYEPGSQGHKTAEERKKFMDDYNASYSGRGRFRGMLLPKGIELAEQFEVEAEKAQFLQTRQFQRTVIAGAFGFPPHLAGDLTKMTFGNVEQQSIDLIAGVVAPLCAIFESAMERDLLTDDDRRAGVVIRFDLDQALRGDFKTRQEGLQIQRQNGVINANDWRHEVGLNPISKEDGGEEYWRKGPSGQSADAPAGGTQPTEEDDDTEETPAEDESVKYAKLVAAHRQSSFDAFGDSFSALAARAASIAHARGTNVIEGPFRGTP